MSEKKQIPYITNARIIGILLVVFGHSYPFNVPIPRILDEARNFIYCFHMPLFVFISAYLVTKTRSIERHGVKEYLTKRTVRLMVPYIGLTVLCFCPKILVSNFINDEVEMSFGYFLKTIMVPRWNVWGHFWFLPMILIMAVISVAYVRIMENNRKLAYLILIVSLALIFFPDATQWFAINDVKNNLFWYLSGIVLGTEASFERILKNKYIICTSLLFSMMAFFLLHSPVRTFIVAVFMILFICAVAGKVNTGNNRLIALIGKNSFSIFILSWPIQAVLEIITNRILTLPVLAVMPVMFVGGLFGALMIVGLLNAVDKKVKIPFLKILVGI